MKMFYWGSVPKSVRIRNIMSTILYSCIVYTIHYQCSKIGTLYLFYVNYQKGVYYGKIYF